ncbi:MAG: hypothetical protein Q8P07_03370 [bacterium]|nr:hypothetical protein [bacterium]
MEIWELKYNKWAKKPFKKFPSSESLAAIMVKHHAANRNDNWVVFTKEEEKLLAEMARPFLSYSTDIAANFLSRVIGTVLKGLFTPAPLITHVPANPKRPIKENQEFLLAIHFNLS